MTVTTYDIELRPPGGTIAGFPGQVRTLRAEPWPAGYLTGRTFEWHLLRAGKIDNPIVIDTTRAGTSLVAELTFPHIDGSWTLTLFEVVAEDHYEPRIRAELRSSRSAAPDTTDITFGPVTVDDGDIVFELNVTLVEVTGEGGGVTDHGDLEGLADDDHPQYLTEDRGDDRYDLTGAAAAAQAFAIQRANHSGVQAIATIIGLQAALDAKALDIDLDAETAARIAADLLLIPLTQKASAGGVATLDGGGKIPSNQLPSIALSEYLGDVASEAAMLALSGQRGDWCVRTEFTPDRIFILKTDDPSSAANWTDITGPGAVLSVDGRTGAVSLSDLYDAAGSAAAAQAFAIQRGNHTGSQLAATISDFTAAVLAVGNSTYVPQDLSTLTGSAAPDADDLVYVWLDGAARKVALSDLAALILANAVLTGTVTIPDGALAIADTSGLQAALDAKLASASYTAADVLAKLLTVDGAGSGLDADLLDGLSSAAFATAAQGATADAAIPKSTADANSLLGATADNTPIAFPVAASRIVGRKASGDIDDMTTAELAALFGTPDGTKFLKDDGTLAVPGGGSVPFTAASASGPASLDFAEDTDNGSHKATVKAAAALAADATLTLPAVTGSLALTEPLAYTRYAPASLATYSINSTTYADADATNLTVTFTAPASGAVSVVQEALCHSAASSGQSWNVRDGSGDIAGTARSVHQLTNAMDARVRTAVRVTGLTPGTSYTWKWGFARHLGSSAVVFFAQSAANAEHPALMEVYAA